MSEFDRIAASLDRIEKKLDSRIKSDDNEFRRIYMWLVILSIAGASTIGTLVSHLII